jgi:hypothetical protein
MEKCVMTCREVLPVTYYEKSLYEWILLLSC